LPDKVGVLTCDDAVRSHATHVAPLLRRYGFGATFFVTEFVAPAFTDSTLYMTWAQIRDLDRQGFEIGNHTAHHTHVPRLPGDALAADLAVIERKAQSLGIPRPRSFAYPAYETAPWAPTALRRAGYRLARVGGNRPFDPARDDPMLIPSYSTSGATRDEVLRALGEARGGRVVVLTVHGVPDEAHPWVSTPPALFDEYLRYLHDHAFTVLALRDLAPYVATPSAADDAR
jgi:peptidoglycan/xylan/chitin deacetylase (PgdA/CDA1 family)